MHLQTLNFLYSYNEMLMNRHSHRLQWLPSSQLNLVSASSNLASRKLILTCSSNQEPTAPISKSPVLHITPTCFPCTPPSTPLPHPCQSEERSLVHSPRTFRCPVPLSPILEPVGHLEKGVKWKGEICRGVRFWKKKGGEIFSYASSSTPHPRQ